MDDYTIKNISQLQEGLAKMKRIPDPLSPRPSGSTTPLTPSTIDAPYDNNIKEEDSPNEYSVPILNTRPQNSASRMNSSQMSSSSLLTNIAALQTTTNNKIDKLADAVIRLNNSIDRMHREQIKQSELLVSIVRNTANITVNVPEGQSSNTIGKNKGANIRTYGFGTSKQLFAEFLLKLLNQIQAQIIEKKKQYTSTRDMDLKLTTQIITAAMDNEFKINGEIDGKIDANSTSHPGLVKVASAIGSIDNTNPMLTPDAFREIFENVESKFFVSCFKKILERMRIIRLLVPFYEADIICAIESPYFNQNGDVICDWYKIVPRNETSMEASVATATITQRKKVAEYLAKGVKERAAVGASIGNM